MRFTHVHTPVADSLVTCPFTFTFAFTLRCRTRLRQTSLRVALRARSFTRLILVAVVTRLRVPHIVYVLSLPHVCIAPLVCIAYRTFTHTHAPHHTTDYHVCTRVLRLRFSPRFTLRLRTFAFARTAFARCLVALHRLRVTALHGFTRLRFWFTRLRICCGCGFTLHFTCGYARTRGCRILHTTHARLPHTRTRVCHAHGCARSSASLVAALLYIRSLSSFALLHCTDLRCYVCTYVALRCCIHCGYPIFVALYCWCDRCRYLAFASLRLRILWQIAFTTRCPLRFSRFVYVGLRYRYVARYSLSLVALPLRVYVILRFLSLRYRSRCVTFTRFSLSLRVDYVTRCLRYRTFALISFLPFVLLRTFTRTFLSLSPVTLISRCVRSPRTLRTCTHTRDLSPLVAILLFTHALRLRLRCTLSLRIFLRTRLRLYARSLLSFALCLAPLPRAPLHTRLRVCVRLLPHLSFTLPARLPFDLLPREFYVAFTRFLFTRCDLIAALQSFVTLRYAFAAHTLLRYVALPLLFTRVAAFAVHVALLRLALSHLRSSALPLQLHCTRCLHVIGYVSTRCDYVTLRCDHLEFALAGTKMARSSLLPPHVDAARCSPIHHAFITALRVLRLPIVRLRLRTVYGCAVADPHIALWLPRIYTVLVAARCVFPHTHAFPDLRCPVACRTRARLRSSSFALRLHVLSLVYAYALSYTFVTFARVRMRCAFTGLFAARLRLLYALCVVTYTRTQDLPVYAFVHLRTAAPHTGCCLRNAAGFFKW